MKRCVFIILLFLTFNLYAQKPVPYNLEIGDSLLSHLMVTDNIPEEFIISVKQQEQEQIEDDCILVFNEPILVQNLLTEQFVTCEELLKSNGIFTFYCPLILPWRLHILLKQQEDIVIIEEHGYTEDIRSKHIEVLIDFFNNHPELTPSYFATYETLIKDTDIFNSTNLE